MKNLLIVLSLVILSGCVAVKHNGSKVVMSKIDRPPIGQVLVASIGDPLLEKGVIYEMNVLNVSERIEGFNYTIPAKKYLQIGFDEKNDFYNAEGVTKNAFADPIDALSVPKATTNEVCVVSIYSNPYCYEGNFSKLTTIAEGNESFQQTLLYSGRVGDKLNISYREFSGNTARPAFNNDVEYDFSTSKTIAYKGAVLEVIDADNTSITYKVIKNFR
jgi:hypothetical protein